MLLWRPTEHEPVTHREWDERLARQAIRTIVADAEAALENSFWPTHPLDDLPPNDRLCSVYLGSAGMAWALWKLGSHVDAPALIEAVIEHHRRSPHPEESHAPSLLVGEVGMLAVAAALGSPAAEDGRMRRLVHENREHPTWEVLYGSPGTLIAARALGMEGEAHETAALLWDRADGETGLWTQDLGGHLTQYLGAGHGFAGNLHALRGYLSDELLRDRATRVLARLAAQADGLVNWPPTIERSDQVRVQWCHGAPGILCTVGDFIPRELALAAGELVWRAGPLRTGPGLCHGTAGNGFAFLKLHELTGDARWLERARRFAVHALTQVERQRAATGRGRYTLFTGDIGVALYMQACLDVDARFPILDVV
jgi:hypothetical protein